MKLSFEELHTNEAKAEQMEGLFSTSSLQKD